MWGKLFKVTLELFLDRYTPTCVGKTPPLVGILDHATVHPHVCGENEKNAAFERVLIGTPPRVWGKRYLVFVVFLRFRYTPTCVGKTNT